MLIKRYNFDTDIQIFNLGDVHRGDNGCNVKLFHKTIKEIKSREQARWVSTGDLLNVALKQSKSDVYKSKPLGEELKLLVEELSEISDKCLGIVESNHHRRFDKEAGMSLDEIICDRLQIPFLGKMGVMNITCGRASYYVVLHHGTGGGRRRGSKTNSTEELGELIPAADVYMEGHTHSFDHFINEVAYIDKKRNLLMYQQSTFVVTGHYLQWEESYAMDWKLRPRPQGSSVVGLKAVDVGKSEYKKIHVELFK